MANLVDTTINGSLLVRASKNDGVNGFQFHGGTDNKQWAITPLVNSKLDLGSPTNPFRNVYADSFQLTVPPQTATEDEDNDNGNDNDNNETNAAVNEVIMKFSDDSENRISSVILGNNLPQNKKEGDTEVKDPASRQGRLLLFGANQSGTYLQTAQKGTADGTFNTITLPDKNGTVSLEGHSHAFKTTDFEFYGTGRDGDPNNAEKNQGAIYGVYKDAKKIYRAKKGAEYGNVTLKNCYGWGSDFLDIFVIRGYIRFIPDTEIKANTRIRLGSIRTLKPNYLPGGLVPLSIYRYSKVDTKGLLTSFTSFTDKNNKQWYESYLDFRCETALKKGTTYGIYFTATYGRIGDSIAEGEEIDSDDGITDDSVDNTN